MWMKIIWYLIFGIFVITPAFSQEKLLLPLEGVDTLSTRGVSEYTSREYELISLIANRDDQVNSVLADNFEIWSVKSNQWVSKENWLETVKQKTNVTIRELTVRHFDDLVIVSFIQERYGALQNEKTAQFIVDVWRKSNKKLNLRYMSEFE